MAATRKESVETVGRFFVQFALLILFLFILIDYILVMLFFRLDSSMGVWEGAAMDSLKSYPGPPCPNLVNPAGGPPLKQPETSAVFYLFDTRRRPPAHSSHYVNFQVLG
jgi:hypothetical protein